MHSRRAHTPRRCWHRRRIGGQRAKRRADQIGRGGRAGVAGERDLQPAAHPVRAGEGSEILRRDGAKRALVAIEGMP